MMIFEERLFDNETIDKLVADGIHPVLAKILAGRGIKESSELNLELKNLLPPNELKNCLAAATYLADAFEQNKPLLIVADYDCDGATACAVGMKGLQELGKPFNAQVNFIVPNRFTMGYGLTPEVVELAANQLPKPAIIITVDNGIASMTGVDRANELGMEVLVTDHHLPADSLPNAACIVNPNQPNCNFKSKALAGVGVMFYVLLALRTELRRREVFTTETQPKLENLLDLVALGTVADVASLDRNNRILVAAGLRRMRQGNCQPGIRALFEVASRDLKSANTFDLGFGIGPRLNAAGRLSDMTLGIRTLISNDFDEAQRLAHELDRMNRERRLIESDMQESALENLSSISIQNTRAICIQDPNWHQGVIGILASRLKEKYHRPVLVFAPGEEKSHDGQTILKGSGRSIAGFHLRDALDWISKKNPEVILKFGGHAMAAGLSIKENDFSLFSDLFSQIAELWLDDSALHRRLVHDGSLSVNDLNPNVAQLITDEVWGQGFPQPVFMGQFKVIKQSILKEKHLKLELLPSQTEISNTKPLQAIWFGHAQTLPDQVDLAYRLVIDHFLGYPRAQLHIEAANLPI